jgi:FkbM family methyltransferase
MYPHGVPAAPQPHHFVEQFFDHRRNLHFVDVGAHNGITINNTISMEENLAWTGICIEPHPAVYAQLCINRPQATCIHACVSEQDTMVNYVQIEGYAEMLSGIMEHYNAAHKQRIRHELQVHGGTCKTIHMDSLRLDTILQRHNMPKVHYLSIDTEGAEMTILRSINLHAHAVELVSLENNYAEEKAQFVHHMQQWGYALVHQMGIELFFARQGDPT